MRLSERQQKQLDELRTEVAQKHVTVLATPGGKQLLAMLETRFFNGELLGDTPEETAFNLGAREVVRVLRNLGALITKQEG
jgi:hypothetical protein